MSWRRETLGARTAVLLVLVSVLAVGLADGIRAGRWTAGPRESQPLAEPMEAVTWRMRAAIAAVAELRERLGVPVDLVHDPNRTGLIGVAHSPITTTIGNLEAKRTSTNPQLAGLILRWLHEAGVGPGAVVAVGASGSFPALILATLLAVDELGAEPVLVSSLGASAWGANHPDFTWGDIEAGLHAQGVIPQRSTAVSMGGERDTGVGLDPDAIDLLERALRRTGVPRIEEADLQANVAARQAAFAAGAAGRSIAAFVNVGGNWAHIGDSAWLLSLGPGLHLGLPPGVAAPEPQERGLMYHFLERGVPVIHLLDIRRLAFDQGLPIDPVPLPEGIGALAAVPGHRRWTWSATASVLVAHVVAAAVLLELDDPNRRYRRES
jgi:poly-gamma-glutamate system protein